MSLDCFKEKYGREEGIKRYQDKKTKAVTSSVSNVSKQLFTALHDLIGKETKAYYAPHSDEYMVLVDNGAYFYDFVIPDLKICVELNGSYWHGDYTKFRQGDLIKGRQVEEVWCNDYTKHKAICERGIDLIYVWYTSNRKFRINGVMFDDIESTVTELSRIINRRT